MSYNIIQKCTIQNPFLVVQERLEYQIEGMLTSFLLVQLSSSSFANLLRGLFTTYVPMLLEKWKRMMPGTCN